jgi:hypothetical protein
MGHEVSNPSAGMYGLCVGQTCALVSSGYRVRREKAVVHSGGIPARELVRSTR